MPCYGPAHTKKRTAECVRKIDSYRIISAAEILSSDDEIFIRLFNKQLEIFPQDRTKGRIHVFQLGEKTSGPIERQNFDGGAYGYFGLPEIFYSSGKASKE